MGRWEDVVDRGSMATAKERVCLPGVVHEPRFSTVSITSGTGCVCMIPVPL